MEIKKVVIVEDASNIRKQLKRIILSIEGLDLAAESEGICNVVSLVYKLNPFAAIIDIGLPDGSGIDLIKELKSVQPNLVIIVFTNYSSKAYSKKCFEIGADYFFDKTNDVDKLIDTLNNFSTN